MATTTANVWDGLKSNAQQNHRMSLNAFMGTISFWTLAGIVFSAVIAYVTPASIGREFWILLLLSIVPFIGIGMTARSSNPLVSLLGYALVAGSFGAMLGPVLATHTSANLVRVMGITGALTIAFGVAGVVYPKSLSHWIGWLFFALLGLIIGRFFVLFAMMANLPVQGALSLLDCIGIGLFSIFILYDLNRAKRLERTHDNAIDVAAALYLNILNLFLSILGQKKD
jgi:FtsH-binding integral membrane protein